MTPPFALPPFDFPLPAYERRAESGLLMPDRRLRKAVLPGLMMPPGLMARASSLLTVDTATVRATDFRNHPIGSQPEDWDWDATYPVSISANGVVSSNCLEYSGAGSSFAMLRWLISFESDASEQETLILAETLQSGSGSGYRVFLGPLVRRNPSADEHVYSAFGRNNGGNRVDTSTRGDADRGNIEAYSWAANTLYWYRIRSEATAVKVKIWIRGNSEPGTWTYSYSRTTSEMPSSVGYAGVIMGSYSVSRTNRVHYIAHCIGGGTAPLPDGE